MNPYYLIVELLVDLVALVMGCVLIFRKSDNLPKFYWGVIAALIGFVFIWENIGWLAIGVQNPTYEYLDILNIEKMVKFYLLASVVSLYPLASLRPGYLNRFRVALFMIPPILVTTIGVCYLFFNGDITNLTSVGQIASNIGRFDVKLRITIFLITIITPLFYFICPLLKRGGQRKINRRMYIFMGFMFSLLVIYILFTLFICDFLFNGFGIVSILFSIFFSVQYLLNENPLSDHLDKSVVKPEQNRAKTDELIIRESPLFNLIDNALKESNDYVNSKFSLELFSKSINVGEKEISNAIKSAGYSSFREYIHRLRLEYFRVSRSECPKKTSKELWVESGFPSKATFYRVYSQVYQESPCKLVDKQREIGEK